MENPEKTIKYFSRVAANYNKNSQLFPWSFFKNKEIAALINLLKKYKINEILEIGCGTGIYTKILNEKFGINIYAVEVSSEMGKQAAKYCEKLVICNFLQMSENTKFQNVFCAGALEFIHCESAWKKIDKISAEKAHVYLLYPKGGFMGLAYSVIHKIMGCPVSLVNSKNLIKIAHENNFITLIKNSAGPLTNVYLFEKFSK